jgi:Rrf2 family transcriptional regulator, iron-sulfur cluster assembly transcription factor
MSRKGLIAIAAVIDVAINARARPVSAKALAARHQLPPRLEPVLQALVRDGILKGFAGRTVATNSAISCAPPLPSKTPNALPNGAALVNEMIRPVLAETERTVSVALGRISIDDMVRRLAVPK